MNENELMAKVASESPEIYEFLNEAAPELRNNPFRNEIRGEMEEALEKAAALSEHAKHYGLPIASTLGVMMATNLAGDLYDAARRGLTKKRDYQKMIKANPDLSEHDPDRVQRAFSTLHRFNPEFAGDPYVAGSIIRPEVEQPTGQTDISTLKDIVQSRKNIRDSRKLQGPSIQFQSKTDRDMQQAQLAKTRADAVKTRKDLVGGDRSFEAGFTQGYQTRGRNQRGRDH